MLLLGFCVYLRLVLRPRSYNRSGFILLVSDHAVALNSMDCALRTLSACLVTSALILGLMAYAFDRLRLRLHSSRLFSRRASVYLDREDSTVHESIRYMTRQEA